MVSEGATKIAKQIQKKVIFAETCKKTAPTSRVKKRKPKFVYDASKDTVRTHASQKISTRKRKRPEPFYQNAFHSMCFRAAKYRKLCGSKQIQSSYKYT